MSADHLLELSPERRELELRRIREREAADLAFERKRRRVMWQCVSLTFLGAPVYAASWALTDPRMTQLAAALGFFISYAAPFFRWLAYHVKVSEAFEG